MTWIAIVFSLASYCFLLGLITFLIKNNKLKGLKALFFLLLVINTLLLPMFTFIISTGAVATFKPVATGYLVTNGFVLVYALWIYTLHLIRNVWSKDDEGDAV